ncbi:MAG: AIR synthase related protein [Bacteroidia bacterium]|nr:AIR synthase related protein [Bacteroidia bacterium]
MSSQYQARGVSAGKEDVHFAISQLSRGLYPRAFCNIMPDLSGQDPDWCTLMHADGAGTKSSLAYLYWRETGDLSVWRGIAQDALVMNLDDMVCAGATGPFLFSNTIGRNKFYIPKEVLAEILAGMEDVFAMLRRCGIEAINTGGETADVGDLVRTLIVDATAFTRMPRREVITNEGIQAGDVIVGLASYGQAAWETTYNSGIGSNGLTNARHDVLAPYYATAYPESFDRVNVPADIAYCGAHRLTDAWGEDLPLNIGQLLLSPTRTYLPLMKTVLHQWRDQIHGLIHNTGGGQTKCLKFVENLHVIKDQLFPVPPVFELIQAASGASWRDMYQVFNMGHRLEIYTDARTAADIISLAGDMGVGAQIVGYCEAAPQNKLTLHGPELVVL